MNNDDNRFTTTLLQWFEENERPLPWRGIGNAYAVWLSEVILQQTRIEQGTDYWFRFMERFPTVEHLAEATEDEVLRLWQGLGYYSRARHLHVAAKQVVQLGGFPKTAREIMAMYIGCLPVILALTRPSTAVRDNTCFTIWPRHCSPQARQAISIRH